MREGLRGKERPDAERGPMPSAARGRWGVGQDSLSCTQQSIWFLHSDRRRAQMHGLAGGTCGQQWRQGDDAPVWYCTSLGMGGAATRSIRTRGRIGMIRTLIGALTRIIRAVIGSVDALLCAACNMQPAKMWAAIRGDVETMRRLIAFGADTNAADDAGYTPLLHVIRLRSLAPGMMRRGRCGPGAVQT